METKTEESPLIICGCPGSGTSLFAKMLRLRGIQLGADAGPIEDRKFHESKSFREVNKRWLDELISFPHAPKGVQQFRSLEKIPQNRIEPLTKQLNLDELFESFWNGSSRQQPWGWKDPRNSATAWIWKTLFPDARIVVLKREWSSRIARQESRSPAGEWFRKESNKRVRQYYWNPIGIPVGELFVVDFDSLLTDENELNRFLGEVQLGSLCIEDFEAFQAEIKIESDR